MIHKCVKVSNVRGGEKESKSLEEKRGVEDGRVIPYVTVTIFAAFSVLYYL